MLQVEAGSIKKFGV